MNIGTYGILIIFGAFILLLIFSPNLSCFGKKIRSPLHPVLGRKKRKQKRIVTEDYGFELGDGEGGASLRRDTKAPEMPVVDLKSPEAVKQKKKIEKQYGFSLDDEEEAVTSEEDS